jgi:hypothetical protein
LHPTLGSSLQLETEFANNANALSMSLQGIPCRYVPLVRSDQIEAIAGGRIGIFLPCAPRFIDLSHLVASLPVMQEVQRVKEQ